MFEQINFVHNGSACLSVARCIADFLKIKSRVIEIGTAYGTHLCCLDSEFVECVTCIDPMYNWVPDLNEDCKFDETLIDQEKVSSWQSYADKFINCRPTLLIAKSADAAVDIRCEHLLANSNILVIDGCHHPVSAVELDFNLFEKFMCDDYFVIWDDLSHGDPGAAFNNTVEKLGEKLIEKFQFQDVGIMHVKK